MMERTRHQTKMFVKTKVKSVLLVNKVIDILKISLMRLMNNLSPKFSKLKLKEIQNCLSMDHRS